MMRRIREQQESKACGLQRRRFYGIETIIKALPRTCGVVRHALGHSLCTLVLKTKSHSVKAQQKLKLYPSHPMMEKRKQSSNDSIISETHLISTVAI